MKCGLFAFTNKGQELKTRIEKALDGNDFRGEAIECIDYTSKEAIEAAYTECGCLIFIGAVGIAVRLVAPFLKDKLTDPAIIVVDEMASFTIPIASGHVGGANEIARKLADQINSIPVITTATDVNGIFAVDEFAASNGLSIVNRESIKRVSKKLLINEPINLAISDDVVITSDANEVYEDELGLVYKPIIIGIGCRKDKAYEELNNLVDETLEELGIAKDKIMAISSIDIKKDEKGLVKLSEELNVPFITFSAKELSEVKGDFDSSSFVEETVGVGDVSARSAKALGKHGKYLLKKKKKDGMTISVYEKYKRVTLSYEKA